MKAIQIQKEDVIEAYRNKHKGRASLLASYYQHYFAGSYTTAFIAEKLSKELGLTINRNMVKDLRRRLRWSPKSGQWSCLD